MKLNSCFLVIILVCHLIHGQNQEPVFQVLNELAEKQIQDHSFYQNGLFPTKRDWSYSADSKDDNNVIATASIIFILKSLEGKLNHIEQDLVNSVRERAVINFEFYRSRKGRPSFNFWQSAEEDIPFPNGGLILERESSRLPDDYNSTSMILLSGNYSYEYKKKVREYMLAYANRFERRPADRTLDNYKNEFVYEVGFVDKMQQGLDICVMSNILLFIFENDFELEKIDRNTIDFLIQVVQNDEYLEFSEELSPAYRTKTWVLYHLARLVKADNEGYFKEIKSKIINDLYQIEASNKILEIERMLIQSSLMRLDVMPQLKLNYLSIEEQLSTFPYLVGEYKSWLPKMTWTSEALNLALYYEYLVLKRSLEN